MTVKTDAHFVDCDIKDVNGNWSATRYGPPGTPEYPTLQALTAAEIPTKPTEPVDTALSGAISVTDKAGLQAIHGAHHYSIDADIDCTGAWTPIANFAGVVEGNGNTISNLLINTPTVDTKALFSSLSTNAQIRNLNFTDCSVTARDNPGILSALTTDKSNIKISNITFTNCTVVGTRFITGSLIGQFAYGSGSVLSHDIYIWDCTASGCTFTDAYGLIGAIGGFNIQIVDCTVVNPTIKGYGAGFAGSVNGFKGEDYVSPPVAERPIIYNCHVTGYTAIPFTNYYGEWRAGGFGIAFAFTDVVSCSSEGQHIGNPLLSDKAYVSGFIDDSQGETYIDCHSTVDMTLYAPIGYVDGFGQSNTDGSHILGCYSEGTIIVDGDTSGYIGGFSAGLFGNEESLGGTYERCYSTVDITANNDSGISSNVGGFIGKVELDTYADVVIQNCYSWGSLLAPDGGTFTWGGFIGKNTNYAWQNLEIINCYDAQTNVATGSGLVNQITPSADGETDFLTGGFLGWNADTEFIVNATNCFWDTTTSGLIIDASTGAVGHDTSWMMTKANYQAAGWDFDTIWQMPSPHSWQVDQIRNLATPMDWTHINGETVQILADGAVLPDVTIVNGSAGDLSAYTTVHVGLQYTSKLQPMKLDSEAYIKRIHKLIPSFYETLGGQFGETEATLDTITFRKTSDEMNDSPDLYTGNKELSFAGSYNRQGDLWIEQKQQLPMNIIGIGIKLETNDE